MGLHVDLMSFAIFFFIVVGGLVLRETVDDHIPKVILYLQHKEMSGGHGNFTTNDTSVSPTGDFLLICLIRYVLMDLPGVFVHQANGRRGSLDHGALIRFSGGGDRRPAIRAWEFSAFRGYSSSSRTHLTTKSALW